MLHLSFMLTKLTTTLCAESLMAVFRVITCLENLAKRAAVKDIHITDILWFKYRTALIVIPLYSKLAEFVIMGQSGVCVARTLLSNLIFCLNEYVRSLT